LEVSVLEGDRVRTGWLVTTDRAHRYPIREFIPRFVPESNYADNFGMQWNLFRQTQLDSYSGQSISKERFWRSTGWSPETLQGKWVLDCGCGAGRFAEVAIGAGANVVALDYSSAVDACLANLGQHPNVHLVQGDIYALPFARGSFPFVYSLGVLQHTPDVAAAFAALPPMVSPQGQLCADFYEMTWKHRLLPRHMLRVFTTRMSKQRVFRMCQRWVPRMLRLTKQIGRIPGIGRLLVRAIPVADYRNVYPLTENQIEEWALLDTFDWLSPQYDQPQQREIVARWIAAAGFAEASVSKAGFMVARGRHKQ
jgi:2-polyprenyl-3-methyl-5-hydroxy-6-metoxy-1,4-benzoquinol methylase